MDTDAGFFTDPYKYLKAPPLRDIQFLGMRDGAGVSWAGVGWPGPQGWVGWVGWGAGLGWGGWAVWAGQGQRSQGRLAWRPPGAGGGSQGLWALVAGCGA